MARWWLLVVVVWWVWVMVVECGGYEGQVVWIGFGVVVVLVVCIVLVLGWLIVLLYGPSGARTHAVDSGEKIVEEKREQGEQVWLVLCGWESDLD